MSNILNTCLRTLPLIKYAQNYYINTCVIMLQLYLAYGKISVSVHESYAGPGSRLNLRYFSTAYQPCDYDRVPELL